MGGGGAGIEEVGVVIILKAEQCVIIKVILFIPFSITFPSEKRESPAGFICSTRGTYVPGPRCSNVG